MSHCNAAPRCRCLPLPAFLRSEHPPPLPPCPFPSASAGIDDDATGARLQRKLHEWQERLAAAARLRESGGQASAGFGSSQSMGGGRSPGASSQSDGLASRVRAAIDSAGAGGAEAAEAADSPRSSSGGAVSAASELDFHSAVSSAAPSPEKGGPLAPASASKPAPGPGSPRIASAWLKGVQASAADEPGAEGDADGGAASPAPAPAGSRIKQMGLQAAEQAPAAAPRAAQQAAAAQQRGRKHRGGRRK